MNFKKKWHWHKKGKLLENVKVEIGVESKYDSNCFHRLFHNISIGASYFYNSLINTKCRSFRICNTKHL